MITFTKQKIVIFVILYVLVFFNLAQIRSYSAELSIPSNIQLTPSKDADYLNGNITIKWSKVDSATAYSIKVTNTTTNVYTIETVAGNSNNQAVINNLIGGISYSVQVKSINGIDFSDWSSSTLTSRPSTLPKAPTKPIVTANTGGADVSWVALTESEKGGGELVSYVVKETVSGTSISTGPTDTSVKFTGLSDGDKARFTVTAVTNVNKIGSTSVSSDEVTIGEVSSSESSAPPSAAPTTSPTATSTPSSGGGGTTVVASGGGVIAGGASSVTDNKQADLNLIIVDPENPKVAYTSASCVDIYSVESVAQLKASACTTEGGLINLQTSEKTFTLRSYESNSREKYLLYNGKYENGILTIDNSEKFGGTNRIALTVPLIPKISPTPTISVSETPRPSITTKPTSTPMLPTTPTPSVSSSTLISSSPSSNLKPTPKITYSLTCTKGATKKTVTGTSPTCPSGFKQAAKVVVKAVVTPSAIRPSQTKVSIKPSATKTISCSKGSSIIKVVGNAPICPKGYKLK